MNNINTHTQIPINWRCTATTPKIWIYSTIFMNWACNIDPSSHKLHINKNKCYSLCHITIMHLELCKSNAYPSNSNISTSSITNRNKENIFSKTMHDSQTKRESLVWGDEKSVLSQHKVMSGHRMDSKLLIDQITVLEWESRDSHRKVMETIYIKFRGDPQLQLWLTKIVLFCSKKDDYPMKLVYFVIVL